MEKEYINISQRIKATCICPPLSYTLSASLHPSNLVCFSITRAFLRTCARSITCNGDLPELKNWVETVVEIGPDDGDLIFRSLLEAKLRTDAQAIGGEYKQV
jgi:hypothetical protein